MPTTTASEIVLMRRATQDALTRQWADNLDKAMYATLTGKSANWVVHDEFSPVLASTSTNLEDFTMRKLGKKLHGFYYKDRGRCVAKYAGSYTTARKKFKVLLITRRLKK